MSIYTLLVLAAAWSAETRIPDYECSAPNGSFGKLDLTGAEGFQISGVIEPGDLGPYRADWLPAAGVLFQPENGRGGLGIQVWRTSKKALTFGFRRLDSDSPVSLGQLPADQPIRFAIGLDPTGHLEFSINGKIFAEENVTVTARRPILMCSSGHFDFQKLSTSSQ